MLRVLASVVAALLACPAPVPAQLRAGADPLRAVGDDGACVVSYDPRPFRGTTLNRYLVPRLAGNRALLTHPQVPNIERVVAAGTLADLSAWQVLAASGVFVAAPSRRRSVLLAGCGGAVRCRRLLAWGRRRVVGWRGWPLSVYSGGWSGWGASSTFSAGLRGV